MPDSTDKPPSRPSIDQDRREFIRKAAYVPPALVVLGLVARTGEAQLDSEPPPPPPPPPSPEDEDPLLDEMERRKRD